jgi:hypothetical protein
MPIGAALAVAAGAILRWAVTAHVSWIDVQTAGTVLFVVGLVALPIAIVYAFCPAFARRGKGGIDSNDGAYGPPSL